MHNAKCKIIYSFLETDLLWITIVFVGTCRMRNFGVVRVGINHDLCKFNYALCILHFALSDTQHSGAVCQTFPSILITLTVISSPEVECFFAAARISSARLSGVVVFVIGRAISSMSQGASSPSSEMPSESIMT